MIWRVVGPVTVLMILAKLIFWDVSWLLVFSPAIALLALWLLTVLAIGLLDFLDWFFHHNDPKWQAAKALEEMANYYGRQQ